jgi:hypothetical protein
MTKKTDEKAPQCQQTLFEGWRQVQCSRRATVDGKWCKQHSPQAKAERDAKSEAAWKAKQAKWEAEYARRAFDRACGDIARKHGITTPEELEQRLT